ncbi:MAG: LysR family transcriptional regulator ArgP [Motiliproteus sp.]|nr:LysR family transcriptional regulator ArgP [Motiliproteus sp.]MCW9053334.1 LysR family transcriptional regulator ArgP [Motiliproteus sp.]
MFDYKQLQALAAVLEESSFDKAATKLHISQSAVSQRLRQLEEQVGQVLIVRGSPLVATETGLRLLKHFRQVELLQMDLSVDLATEQSQGFTKVKIGLNADSLATWFLDAIEGLLREEQLLVELEVDDQDQTHRLLKSGQVMGCISSSPQAIQGCNCLPLGVMPYRCLASPQYIQNYFPNGINKTDFSKAPVAEFNNKDELQNRYLEKFFKIGANEYPKHRIPSSESFFQLILKGLACGMVPDQQSREYLDSGVVVDLSPGNYLAVPLYWHVWSLDSMLARKLTNALSKTAALQLDSFEQHQI